MDERTEQSFNKLKKTVLDDVQKKVDEIENSMEDETKKTLSQKRAEFSGVAEKKVNAEISKAQRRIQSDVLERDMQVKRELIKHREKLIDSVFENAAGKLNEFKKTQEYNDWLISKAKEALNQCGDGSILFTCSDDADKLSELEIKTEICDILGGVKAENREKGIISDFSFDVLLEGARNEFLKTGGLTIEI